MWIIAKKIPTIGIFSFVGFLLMSFIPVFAGTASAEFTLIVLPDTQNYSSSYPDTFIAQTQWIVDNKDMLNIVYVAHLGDIVNTPTSTYEYENAYIAMSLLEDPITTGLVHGIPYSVVPGNHDQPTNLPGYYNTYFGVSHFSDRCYYGGSYDNNNDDNYTLFSAEGIDFILINIGYVYNTIPDIGVLNWANNLLQTYSDRKAIVVSHDMLYPDGSFSSVGETIYNALKDNPNMFLMLCGHNSGEAIRVETYNDYMTYILLSSWQSLPNGGNGWLRIMEFSTENNQITHITVNTYSPTLDQYGTDIVMGDNTTSEEFVINYEAPNQKPVVNAGSDQMISLPDNTVFLDGMVADDGLPDPPGEVSTTWSMVSGPATVVFGDASAEGTTAMFSEAGTYVLTLEANDGELTSGDEVTIVVHDEGADVVNVDVRVAGSSDDAEESPTSGMYVTSSDLELVTDADEQTVGIRFAGLAIPRGATIVNAYVQFSVDETSSEVTSLIIEGEDIDDAPQFTSAPFDISSRARTQASVSWSPAAWNTVGQEGPDQRTPDISPVIQEIVNRLGWSSGNSLAVIMTGTGKRVAASYEGNPAGAPLLHVKYSTEQSGSGTSLGVWVVDGMQQVKPDAPAATDTSIELFAAKGEYEPFQIIIKAPRGGLTNVNVLSQDLSGPGGQSITKNNITLYREHYVHLTQGSSDWGGSNRPLGPGWYPEPLIPFVDPQTGEDLAGAQLDAVPFNLAENMNQPIWVDVFIPRDIQAGQYTGVFSVTSDQGNVDIQLILNVWNFELPLKPSFTAITQLWNAGRKETYAELLKHKYNPYFVRSCMEGELIDEHGLMALDTGFWSGSDYGNCSPMPSPPSLNDVRHEVERHQNDLMLYAHYADEIQACPDIFDDAVKWSRRLRKGGVKPLLPASVIPGLMGDSHENSAADIWVVLPFVYDMYEININEVMQRGEEVWSYNTLVQDSYSPKWTIDFAPVNFRIHPGFISQSLGLTGLLNWVSDYWTEDPWNDQTLQGDDFPGDGVFVYPGNQVGISSVVAGMRLKWIREGIEDWEYIQILRCSGQTDLADFALNIANQIGPDWTNWTRDTDELYAARMSLGDKIHQNSALPLPLPPVRIIDTPPAYYSTLQTAYDNAGEGDTIEVRAEVMSENININRDISITLKGGCNCDYSDNSDKTIINGMLTVNNGTIIVENLVLK